MVGSGDSSKLSIDHREMITIIPNKSVSVGALMELVGHSCMSITHKYIDVNPNIVRSAFELL